MVLVLFGVMDNGFQRITNFIRPPVDMCSNSGGLYRSFPKMYYGEKWALLNFILILNGD